MVTAWINNLPLCHICSVHFHSLPEKKLETHQYDKKCEDTLMINIIPQSSRCCKSHTGAFWEKECFVIQWFTVESPPKKD